MKDLKTITDEGKREFEELAWRVENTDDPEIIAFIHGFAEKIATETMKAILPEDNHSFQNSGNETHYQRAQGYFECRASVEQAFQSFLGKN